MAAVCNTHTHTHTHTCTETNKRDADTLRDLHTKSQNHKCIVIHTSTQAKENKTQPETQTKKATESKRYMHRPARGHKRVVFCCLLSSWAFLSLVLAQPCSSPSRSGLPDQAPAGGRENKTNRERSGNAHGHGTTSLKPGRARTKARPRLDSTWKDAHTDIMSGQEEHFTKQ